MIGKKAKTHVEMIISFVIFVGFVIFLFIILNPFQRPLDSTLLDSAFFNIEEKTNTNISSVSLKLTNTAYNDILNSRKDCFEITGFKEVLEDLFCDESPNINRYVIVKNKAGNIVNSWINSANPTKISIGFSDNQDSDFYTLYCSEEFVTTKNPLKSCHPLNNGEDIDYVLGTVVERSAISEIKLRAFEDEYKNNYPALKSEIVPDINDFSFIVWEVKTNSKVYEGVREIPRTRVDAKTYPISTLNNQAEIKKRTMTIKFW